MCRPIKSIGAHRRTLLPSACQSALNIVRRAFKGFDCSSLRTSSLCLVLRKSARRSWSSSVRTGRPVSGLTMDPLNGPLRGAP